MLSFKENIFAILEVRESVIAGRWAGSAIIPARTAERNWHNSPYLAENPSAPMVGSAVLGGKSEIANLHTWVISN